MVTHHRPVPSGRHHPGRRTGRFFVFFAIPVFFIGLGVFLFHDPVQDPFLAIAVAGDPVAVVFVDRTAGKATILSFPASTVITTSASYGSYPVSSLWRLGEMEKMGGRLFADSVGGAVGIPVRYFIGSEQAFTDTRPTKERLPELFSYVRIPALLGSSIRTNLPLGTVFRIAPIVREAAVAERNIDLSGTFGVSADISVDGTREELLNTEGVDRIIKQTFEIPGVRKENIRILVINATGKPGLGQKITRMISHVGMNVVGIGSEDHAPPSCEVTVQPAIRSTVTVRTLLSVFSCALHESTDTGRADLILRLGEKDRQL